jgi:hypothetical protein
MNSFDHMVMALQNSELEMAKYSAPPPIKVEVNPQKIKITKDEYKEFYKEFVFDKLKGKTLSECFSSKFGITDMLFQIRISDEEAQNYIKQYYIK